MAEETKNDSEKSAEQKQEKTDARIRDEKGHFVSANGKKTKKPNKQKAEDNNTVKIKIIKQEEPLPPRDFEGRLEDMKERTATQFIKSVCRRKPRRISIDGNNYYSQEVVDELVGENIEKEDDLQRAYEVMGKGKDTMLKGVALFAKLGKALETVRHSRFIWRSIAIGLLAAFVSYFGTKAVQKFCFKESLATNTIEQTAVAPKK